MFTKIVLASFILALTTQTHAGFMFCESKLKKIGLTKKEAKSACDSSFIDSTKEMLETEDPKEMAKVIKLMSSSEDGFYNVYTMKYTPSYKISDPKIALKVVKILPDEALGNFYSLAEKFGLDNAVKMAELLPPEKMKYAHKIAVKYSSNQASFYNLINTATIDQLETYTLLIEKFPDGKVPYINSKYSKKSIECGLSFTNVSSSENYKYEDYISLCEQHHTGKLCGAKTMLLTTALKDPASSMSSELMNHLTKSDHFTKNHALLYNKIYSAGFYSDMYSTVDKLLKNENISDEVTNKILKEFKNPFVTSNMIIDLLAPALSNTTLTGRTFEESGAVAANWGNGSLSACSSKDGRAAISKVSKKVQSQCQKFYEGKNGLECDIEVDRNKSEGICKFKVTVKSRFEKDKTLTKSCYTQDLEDGISAVNKINKTEKDKADTFVNETRLQKENQTPDTGASNERNSTKTSDR